MPKYKLKIRFPVHESNSIQTHYLMNKIYRPANGFKNAKTHHWNGLSRKFKFSKKLAYPKFQPHANRLQSCSMLISTEPQSDVLITENSNSNNAGLPSISSFPLTTDNELTGIEVHQQICVCVYKAIRKSHLVFAHGILRLILRESPSWSAERHRVTVWESLLPGKTTNDRLQALTGAWCYPSWTGYY